MRSRLRVGLSREDAAIARTSLGKRSVLPDHAESEVRRRRGDVRFSAFEGDGSVEGAEQRSAGTDQHGNHVHVDLVDKSERKCLLENGRAEQVDDACRPLTRWACSTALATPSVTNVNTAG